MPPDFVASVLSMTAEHADYTRRLVADLRDEQMIAQPVAGVVMNHPAWILCHLSVYGPVMAACLRGEPFDDPRTHRFGMGSRPVNDLAAYPPRERVIAEHVAGCSAAAEALRAASPARLAEPPPLERWKGRFPDIAFLVMHLMVRHPAVHLGQLSAWRRAMGLPPV
jgi:hypothetical protein